MIGQDPQSRDFVPMFREKPEVVERLERRSAPTWVGGSYGDSGHARTLREAREHALDEVERLEGEATRQRDKVANHRKDETAAKAKADQAQHQLDRILAVLSEARDQLAYVAGIRGDDLKADLR